MMRSDMKIVLGIIAALAAAAAAVFFGALWLGERKIDRRIDVRVVPVAYARPDPQVLQLGKYLFESRGCAECHGADGAGRVVIDDAAGGMYVRSPDITPARTAMVAAYTEADWVRSIRHGVDPAGRALLVMPSEDYARMNDGDLAALVAYIRSLPPGRGGLAEVRLPTIVRVMYGLGVFKDAFEKIDHRLPPAQPIAVGETPEHGGYVAAMCSGCHGHAFSGGGIPGAPPDWPPASNLTPGEGSVMPRYATVESFMAMLRTGKRPDGSAVSKVMPFETLGNLNDTDVKAIHAYLKTLPPRKTGQQ
jgi:mono/diheme cytochrome c family protein